MRSDLDHLPANKQRELERIVQIIFEEFEDAFALSRHEWKKAGRILKVILYGSYARGTWVDEPHKHEVRKWRVQAGVARWREHDGGVGYRLVCTGGLHDCWRHYDLHGGQCALHHHL